MDTKVELENLGILFKKVRRSKGLTQAQLAHRIDKDQQSIQRFEKGGVNPTYIYLLEICKGLEMSLIDVLTFNDEKSCSD